MSVYVDSHCHLDDPTFDVDRDPVIERARTAGLKYALTIGGASGPDQLASGLPIAEAHDWIFTSAGIHPHEAARAEERHFQSLLAASAHSKVIGIGEIGLDYFYDHSPRETQKQVLIRQIEIARAARLPIIIHCRDAWADMTEIAENHWAGSGLGGILHCFGGSREDAARFLDWGFMVSFAGNVTFKKAENIREAARYIPLDRLLTETDCPYLAPVPMRGKRNEPAFVVEVTRALAALRNLSDEEMGARAVENFTKFFGIENTNRAGAGPA